MAAEHFDVAKGAPQVILALAKPDAALDGRARMPRSTRSRPKATARSASRGGTIGARRGWRFLGLLPLFDPPREDAAATIEQRAAHGCRYQDGHRRPPGDRARDRQRPSTLGQNILPADQAFGKTRRGARPGRGRGRRRLRPGLSRAQVRHRQGACRRATTSSA